jgi:hypothetical protein
LSTTGDRNQFASGPCAPNTSSSDKGALPTAGQSRTRPLLRPVGSMCTAPAAMAETNLQATVPKPAQ